MKTTSWRHHYIPQFYLNGFLSSEGNFKIYDIRKNQFVKHGKDFSSKSFFFEKYGNLLTNEKEETDIIEKEYGKIESKVAVIFNHINSSSIEKYKITDEDIAMLQFFIGVMYWRIPSNNDQVKSIINRKELKELGLDFKNKDNETATNKELENRIKKDNNFFKSMKLWFPHISYPEIFNCNTPMHIIPIPKGLPAICSDNPIICRNPSTFRVYSDNFIFPLNATNIFIRGETKKDLLSTIKIEIDMLIFKQAKYYVSCTDEKYIEELDKLYFDYYKSTNKLRELIFEKILNYST